MEPIRGLQCINTLRGWSAGASPALCFCRCSSRERRCSAHCLRKSAQLPDSMSLPEQCCPHGGGTQSGRPPQRNESAAQKQQERHGTSYLQSQSCCVTSFRLAPASVAQAWQKCVLRLGLLKCLQVVGDAVREAPDSCRLICLTMFCNGGILPGRLAGVRRSLPRIVHCTACGHACGPYAGICLVACVVPRR